MTGLTEMASTQPWNPSLNENHSVLDDRDGECFENSNSIDRPDKIIEIPSSKSDYAGRQNSSDGHRVSKYKVENDDVDTSDSRSSFIIGDGDVNSVSQETRTVKMGKDLRSDSNSRSNDETGNIVTAHLRHVHSNPFFLEHGVLHPHGHIYNKSTVFNNEENGDEQVYAPNSGFVSKLRQKFINVKKDDTSQQHKSPRRYASVENLLGSQNSPTEIVKSNRFPYKSNTTENFSDKVTRFKPTVPKPIPHRRKFSDSSYDKTDRGRIKSHEAPDIKIGRDDIIIIEQTKPTKQKEKSAKDDVKMMSGKIKPLKDTSESAEMPKPNTVSSFRSIFEKSSGTVPTNILPDTLKFHKTTTASTKYLTQKQDFKGEGINSSNVTKPAEEKNNKIRNEVASECNNEDRNIKPSTLKEKAKETPRLLDSPVTRKKTYPDKKSIFDSESICSNQKESVTIYSCSNRYERDTSFDTNIKVSSSGSQVKKSDTTSSNIKSNTAFKNEKVSVNNVTKSEEKTKDAWIEYFPNRKEIFDSSTISKSPQNDQQNISIIDVKTKSDDKKVKSEELFPSRKEIFDSSSISTTNTSSFGKRKRAPATPRALHSSSKDDILKNPPKEAVPETVTHSETPDKGKNSVPSVKSEGEDAISLSNSRETKSISNSVDAINTPRKNLHGVSKEDIFTPRLNHTPSVNGNVLNSPSEPLSNDSPMRGLPSVIANRNSDGPTKGVPSVIANRLRQTQGVKVESGEIQKEKDDDDEKEVIEISNLRPSQLKNKTFINVPNKETQNDYSGESPSSVQKKSGVPVSNIDDLIRGKRSTPAPLFDSSSIVPKSKPKPVSQGVPPLDISDLITPEKNHPYQEGYIPTKILPCTIIFEGAGVTLSTTPLKKTRSNHKMKLQFNDEAVQTHEYLREEHALEEYLNNNPNEKEAVVKEELLKLDDVDSGEDESTDEPVTPRDTTESPLRTNTAIGAGSGELSNYKPKHQEEFQFGMSLKEAEPVPEVKVIEEPDPDDLHLRPADEEDLHDFSTNETSDMLF